MGLSFFLDRRMRVCPGLKAQARLSRPVKSARPTSVRFTFELASATPGFRHVPGSLGVILQGPCLQKIGDIALSLSAHHQFYFVVVC